MNKKNITTKLLSIFFWISIPCAQNRVSCYLDALCNILSSIDINTGESNMPIFMAELSREDANAPQPVNVDIEFEIIIDSDALGVENETLVRVETTQPLQLTAPIHLTNMDLNLSTDMLFDTEGNQVELNLDITEQMDLTEAEQMMSLIVQTGQLPNGIYTFRVIATAENGQQNY